VPFHDPGLDIVGQLAGVTILVLFYLVVVISRQLVPAQMASVDAQG
jgi:hypothetical protein